MAGWLGVQEFEIPDDDDTDYTELDFCCPFDAGAHFFKRSRIGPTELVTLLRIVSQVYSPPVAPIPASEVRAAKQELATLQKWVANLERRAVDEDVPEDLSALFSNEVRKARGSPATEQ